MKRWCILIYGVASYAMFFGVFLYAILFLGNFAGVRALDSQPTMDPWLALAVDFGLLMLFALQHSGMARPGFKKWLTRWIPQPAERSTYVLVSNLAMIALFVLWQPIGGYVWSLSTDWAVIAIYATYFAGWVLLFYSTCAICHFDLFGLRQVWLNFRGQPYRPYEFRVPGIYKFVRHPIYVAWLIIFWATPTMTFAHLVFAVGTTIYILAAIQLEERDLIGAFGKSYRRYQARVPMLVPWVGLIATGLRRFYRKSPSGRSEPAASRYASADSVA